MTERLLTFTDAAWQDYLYWQGQDKKNLKTHQPAHQRHSARTFRRHRKPEPLKFNLAGYWSRRIDETHRLVYAVDDHAITLIACRYHYG